MSQVWCGIPVYNNAGTIADVVRRCRQQISDIVVVDDGSSDADLRQLLEPLDVAVIRHPANLGKGAALMTAFEYAAQRGGQYMITLDGDGQHFPEDIPRFLPHLAPHAILIGQRTQVVGAMPQASQFGREFSDFWIYVECGQAVADTQSGFRVYPLPRISQLRLKSRHYNLEVEVVTRAVWAGLKIEDVPVRVQYLDAPQRASSFRPFRDNLRISLTHARLVLRQLLPIPHRRLAHISLSPGTPGEGRGGGWFKSLWFENSTPLGLAAAAALSALLGILLWPWGALAVAYLAIRLHLNKIVALATLALCAPTAIPKFCTTVGQSVVYVGSSPGWTRFAGAHIVAFTAAPLAALLVYAVARRLQEPGQ